MIPVGELCAVGIGISVKLLVLIWKCPIWLAPSSVNHRSWLNPALISISWLCAVGIGISVKVSVFIWKNPTWRTLRPGPAVAWAYGMTERDGEKKMLSSR